MAARSTWKGYLKLSLVSCAVALFPATTTSGRVRFNIINRETGHRVNNLVVDAETGEPVEQEDRIKGYKTGNGRYVLLEEEEIERVALESTHTIDIDAFFPRDEVDSIYLDESYYIAPTDKVGVEAFAVIRRAMEKSGLVGLARVVLYRRERLLMLAPRGKGILATSLRYANEVRAEEDYFEDIPSVKISADMLDLATHILDGKKARFDPSKFKDRYEKALTDLIKAKGAGKEIPEPPKAAPSNVVSLMDALRKSVQAEKGGASRTRRSSSWRSTATRSTARARSSTRRRIKKAG